MSNRLLEATVLETFIYIIAGWVVISTWQRFIENYAYNGLGMNREMPYHNFIVAMVISGIFIIVVTAVSKIMEIEGNYIAGEESEFNPGFIPASSINNQRFNKDEYGTEVNLGSEFYLGEGEHITSSEDDDDITLRKVRKRNTRFHINKATMSSSRRKGKHSNKRDN